MSVRGECCEDYPANLAGLALYFKLRCSELSFVTI